MARKLGSSQLLTGDPGFEDAYLDARARGDAERPAARGARVARARAADARAGGADGHRAGRGRAAGGARARRGRRRPALRPAARAARALGPSTHAYTLGAGVRLLVQPRREIPVVAAARRAARRPARRERGHCRAHQLPHEPLAARHAGARRGRVRAPRRVARGGRGLLRRAAAAAASRSTARARASRTCSSCSPTRCSTPAFSEEEIERERRDTLAALARREDRLGVRAFDLFTSAHWERHPYRLPLPGTPETVTRFEREELLAHHERLVRADNLVIAVVGDVDPDERRRSCSDASRSSWRGSGVEASCRRWSPRRARCAAPSSTRTARRRTS